MKEIKNKTKIWAIVCVVAFLVPLCITTNSMADEVPLSVSVISSNKLHMPGIPVPRNGYGYSILWSRTWSDGDYMNTTGEKVATDSNNNIIVYARACAQGPYENVIMKYSPSGTRLWVKHVNLSGLGNVVDLSAYAEDGNTLRCSIPPESPYTRLLSNNAVDDDMQFFSIDIGVDSDDNIIFLGDLWLNATPVNQEYVVVFKYDSNGNELWKNKYDYLDFIFPGEDMAIDADDCVYVPCTNYLSNFVLKITPSGDVDWFKSIGVDFFCLPLSVAIDSNGDPISTALNCIASPSGTTDSIEFTKFNHVTGQRLIQTEISIPRRGNVIVDAGLVVDKTDNSVFFGFLDRIYKIAPSLEYFSKLIPYTFVNFDLKISGEMLIACGGWIDVRGVTNYYSAIYNKDTGAKILDMPLGALIYCLDPFFQQYFQHMKAISIDRNGDVVFSGGEGGLRLVKIHITRGVQPQIVISDPIQ